MPERTRIFLKSKREDSLKRHHPWIFSGAIKAIEGEVIPGAPVTVCRHDGKPLACGTLSPESQIRVRCWGEPDIVFDEAFFFDRIQRAANTRQHLNAVTNAQRLIFSEADAMPGLILDRYGNTLVMQCLAAGTDYFRDAICGAIHTAFPSSTLFERSDVAARSKEGLPQRVEQIFGSETPERILIEEHGIQYYVDVRRGHKTGFYLDQRDNRKAVQTLSKGCEVLNIFSYTGGFGLAALAGRAAHVMQLDASADALAMAKEHEKLNAFENNRCEYLEANAFEALREFEREDRRFDLIVLDPPKFIDNKKQTQRGARAYKDINLQAFKLLRQGGLLLSFSCSGLMPRSLLQKIIADAALDAGCEGHIIRQLYQASDHPIRLNFPEADYLKGFAVKKL